MANNWQTDKRWSDKFLPEIKQLLGLYLIGEPPIEEDCERNTDLMVLKMEAVRIGCRVRRHTTEKGYPVFDKHKDEFTIRYSRPSHVKCELTKIIEGWGDYFFYAFATKDETGLNQWVLCRYRVFRIWFNRYLAIHAGRMPGVLQKNGDKSSDFYAYKLRDMPKDFVVASSWDGEDLPTVDDFEFGAPPPEQWQMAYDL
jgi:hypothetical protein